MIPEPYFIVDPRNNQIRLRQNHATGRQLVTIPNERAETWLAKKGRPKDADQWARLQNIINRLEALERRLTAKGLINPPLSVVWAEQFKPEDPDAPTSNLIRDWCSWRASLSGYHYRRGFLNIIAHLDDWGRPGALLVDINETWITKYCEYLSKERGLRTSSINKTVAYMRNVVKAAAINNQPVGTIPDRLRKATIGGKPSAARLPITIEEVMKLIELENLPRHLATIRDMFVLMCFTGVRVGDLLQPHWVIMRDRIINTQGKTGGLHTITLNKFSREIIQRYSTVGIDGNYHIDLPLHTGQYLNRQYLKLAGMIHTKKAVTNHIARHTFARMLSDMGLNESLRAAELGHKSARSVTAGYGGMEADFQVKLVGKRWERAIAEWKGDYEKWYEAVNS